MNLSNSSPHNGNPSMVWLLAVAVIFAALAIGMLANHNLDLSPLLPVVPPVQEEISASQPVPQVLPIPVPGQNLPSAAPRISGTPVPPGALAGPVAQPVPEPPAGK